MKHIVFLIYIITFMLGIIVFTLSALAYNRSKSKLIKHLLHVHGFFSLILIADILNLYGYAFFSRYLYMFHFFIMLIMAVSVIGFIAYLYIALYEITYTQIAKSTINAFGVISTFLICVNILLIFLGMNQTISLGTAIHTGFFSSNIFMSLLLALFFYLTYKQFDQIHEEFQQAIQIIFKITLVIIPLSIILNLTSYELSSTYPIALSPLVYVLINSVILIKGRSYLMQSYKSEENKQLTYEELAKYYDITQREFEIMELITDGCTNQIIGEKLNISPNTVRNHISSIFKKIGVANRFELINYMIRGQLPDSFDE